MLCEGKHLLKREVIPVPNTMDILVHWVCQLCHYTSSYRRKTLKPVSAEKDKRSNARIAPACCIYCGKVIYTTFRLDKHYCSHRKRHEEENRATCA